MEFIILSFIDLDKIIDDSRKERNKLQYTCKELGQEIEK